MSDACTQKIHSATFSLLHLSIAEIFKLYYVNKYLKKMVSVGKLDNSGVCSEVGSAYDIGIFFYQPKTFFSQILYGGSLNP
jgi:hypothetical protein